MEDGIGGVGWGKSRVIEEIVRLCPKWQVGGFGKAPDREALENREVHVHQPRANKFVPASVSHPRVHIDRRGKDKAVQLDVAGLLTRRRIAAVAARQPVRKVKGHDAVETQRVSTDVDAEWLTGRGMKNSAELPPTGQRAEKARDACRMRHVPHRINDQLLSSIRVAMAAMRSAIDI